MTRTLGIFLAAVLAAMLPAPASAQEAVSAKVVAGESGYEIPVEVTNRKSVPVRHVTVSVSERPPGLANVTVSPPVIDTLPAGETATVTVRFDVAADARPAERAGIAFRITAPGVEFDNPAPRMVIAIAPGAAPPGGKKGSKEKAIAGDHPVVYRLVRVSGASEEDPLPAFRRSRDCTDDFRSGVAGGTIRCTYSGLNIEKADLTLRFTEFPLEITAGQPEFEIGGEVIWRPVFNGKIPCVPPRGKPPADASPAQLDARQRCITGGLNARLQGSVIVAGDAGTAPFTVRYKLESRTRVEGSHYYKYAGSWNLPGPPPGFLLKPGDSVIADERGFIVGFKATTSEARKQHHIEALSGIRNDQWVVKVGLHNRWGFVALYYRPVLADGDYLKNVAQYQVPRDMLEGPRVASADGKPGGQDGKKGGEKDSGKDTGRSDPGTAGRVARVDPRRVDPRSRDAGALIREWLGVAEPPVNARGGNARYDQWGRVVGLVSGARAAAAAPPDAGGKTPEEFAWSRRDRLDSLNHCTLGTYVSRRLGALSIDDCVGAGIPPGLVALGNVIGMAGKVAKERLEGQGLKVALKLGPRAPRPDQSFAVRSQAPRAGAMLGKGDRVSLVVFAKYARQIPVPDVSGLSGAAARKKLTDAGFKATLRPGRAPARAEDAFSVIRSEPPAGRKAANGTTVVLTTYGPFDDRVKLPSVIGQTADAARDALRDLGIDPWPSAGRKARTREEEGTVYAQKPAAGVTVSPRQRVTLTYYDRYVFKGPMPNLVGLSRAEASQRLIDMGLKADVAVAGIAPGPDRTGHVASQSIRPGTRVAEGDRVRLVFFGQSAEERLADTNCRGLPGTEPRWDASAGRAGCGCKAGLVPAADRKSCVRPKGSPRDGPQPIAASGRERCVVQTGSAGLNNPDNVFFLARLRNPRPDGSRDYQFSAADRKVPIYVERGRNRLRDWAGRAGADIVFEGDRRQFCAYLEQSCAQMTGSGGMHKFCGFPPEKTGGSARSGGDGDQAAVDAERRRRAEEADRRRRAEEDRRRRQADAERQRRDREQQARLRQQRQAEAQRAAMLRQQCPALYRQIMVASQRGNQFDALMAQRQAGDIGCDYFEMTQVLAPYNAAAARGQHKQFDVDRHLRSMGLGTSGATAGRSGGGTATPRGPDSRNPANWSIVCDRTHPCPDARPSPGPACILGMC